MFTCLLITCGRDAPGINAAIRSVTRIAVQNRGWKVTAARRGIPGLLAGALKDLGEKDIRFILDKGGSVLGSSGMQIAGGDHAMIRRIAGALRPYDLVVATGGLGSFSILNQVYEANDMGTTTTMFIPSSIENEFIQPERRTNGHPSINAESIGADSAANAAVTIIDRLRDQSYLNQTVFLVQCVGAKSNYLPLTIGLACGAHRIYLPGYPPLSDDELVQIRVLSRGKFQPDHLDAMEFVGWIRDMFVNLKKTYLVVIIPSELRTMEMAHGSQRSYEDTIRSLAPSNFSLLRLVDELEVHFTDLPEVQIRSVILDDLQRGGAPTLRDRLLGTLYGEAAVEEFLQVANSQDLLRRGNLNLLAVRDVNSGTWCCHPRQEVTPMFRGADANPGGLPPVLFYRQSQGLLSGYRPLADL